MSVGGWVSQVPCLEEEGGYPRSHVRFGGAVSQVSCLGKGWISLGGIGKSHITITYDALDLTIQRPPACPLPPGYGTSMYRDRPSPPPLPDMFKLVHYETHTFGKQEARILLECFLVRRLFALLFSRKEVRKTIEKENMVVLVIIHQRKGELLLKKIEKIF